MAQTETETRTDTEIKYPSLYNVVFYNDEKTPIQFVIEVLIEIFNKNIKDATHITMDIHEKGKGAAGVYTMEIAENKVAETTKVARLSGFPLVVAAEEI